MVCHNNIKIISIIKNTIADKYKCHINCHNMSPKYIIKGNKLSSTGGGY